MRRLTTIPLGGASAARARLSSALARRGVSAPGARQGSEPLIDARAAGRLLGVPHTWVLAQARAGSIPHHRLGHYVRFRRSDLEAWLLETRIGPAGHLPPPGHVPPPR